MCCNIQSLLSDNGFQKVSRQNTKACPMCVCCLLFTHSCSLSVSQVLCVQIKCFQEIITIGYSVYHSYDLPWFRTLSWWDLRQSPATFIFAPSQSHSPSSHYLSSHISVCLSPTAQDCNQRSSTRSYLCAALAWCLTRSLIFSVKLVSAALIYPVIHALTSCIEVL